MRSTTYCPEGATTGFAKIATCQAAGYQLLYGSLGTVASYDLTGARCNVGTLGQALWFGVPAGDLWFVVVSNDGSGTEGSWGIDGDGTDRNGTTPSNLCGNTARENAGTCPASP